MQHLQLSLLSVNTAKAARFWKWLFCTNHRGTGWHLDFRPLLVSRLCARKKAACQRTLRAKKRALCSFCLRADNRDKPLGGVTLSGGRRSAEGDNGLKFQTPSENVPHTPTFYVFKGCVLDSRGVADRVETWAVVAALVLFWAYCWLKIPLFMLEDQKNSINIFLLCIRFFTYISPLRHRRHVDTYSDFVYWAKSTLKGRFADLLMRNHFL